MTTLAELTSALFDQASIDSGRNLFRYFDKLEEDRTYAALLHVVQAVDRKSRRGKGSTIRTPRNRQLTDEEMLSIFTGLTDLARGEAGKTRTRNLAEIGISENILAVAIKALVPNEV